MIYTTSEGSDYSVFKDLGDNQSISYFSGRFIVTIRDGYLGTPELYDLESQKWISTEFQNFFIDVLDPRSKIISTPNSISIRNIVDYIPEISNTFLSLEEYTKYSNINIIRKYDDWYVFRYKQSSKKDFFIYSCIDKLVYTANIDGDPILINNSLLMIRTINKELDLDYYTIYHDQGITYYTENAKALLNGNELEFDKDLGILVSKDETFEEYKKYYKEGKILIVHRNNPTGIFGTVFMGFRRSFFREELRKEVPEIIASFYGIMYYINEDGYLNYL